MITYTDGTTLEIDSGNTHISSGSGRAKCSIGLVFDTIRPLDEVASVTVGDIVLPVSTERYSGARAGVVARHSKAERSASSEAERLCYRWYSNSRLYRDTMSPSRMPISSSRSNRPDWRSILSNQLRDS